MNKEDLILILGIWIVSCMSVSEIRNQEVRAEVKEAVELVMKANSLCKEAK